MTASTAHQATADWLKTQQQYWDTWFAQQRQVFTNLGGAANASTSAFQGPQEQWAELLKNWQNIVSGATAGNGAQNGTAVFQQYFTKAGETYLNMLQQFYQATGQSKPLDIMTQEWAETLKKNFGQAFNGQDPLSAIDPFNFLASFPGIGYTREKQEQLNHLYQQWSEFEQKAREYTAEMTRVGLEAVQKFQEYVAKPPEGATPLKSLKQVYAKWVDICEEIYAKYAMTEQYTELYGEVVNALMAFKKKQNEVFDDMLGQFNMPTRAEVDSLHQRLHELRREVQSLKSELKGKSKPVAAPAQKTSAKGKKK